jgi:acyl carrier protein
MTTERPIADRVLDLVLRIAGPARTPANAGVDTPLGAGGFWLDSVDLVEVAVACEQEFALVFEGEDDLTREALATARSLAEVIAEKRAG